MYVPCGGRVDSTACGDIGQSVGGIEFVAAQAVFEQAAVGIVLVGYVGGGAACRGTSGGAGAEGLAKAEQAVAGRVYAVGSLGGLRGGTTTCGLDAAQAVAVGVVGEHGALRAQGGGAGQARACGAAEAFDTAQAVVADAVERCGGRYGRAGGAGVAGLVQLLGQVGDAPCTVVGVLAQLSGCEAAYRATRSCPDTASAR